MCLPRGECRGFWPESTGATCNVRERPTDCSAKSSDARKRTAARMKAIRAIRRMAGRMSHAACAAAHEAGNSLGWTIGNAMWSIGISIRRRPRQHHHLNRCTAQRMGRHVRRLCPFRVYIQRRARHYRRAHVQLEVPGEPYTAVTRRPGSHVLERCVWVYGARACAQGEPVECTPAQVTWIPTALTRTPSQGTEAERDASIQAAEAQGAPPDPSVFDSVHARDVEHSVSPVAQVARASGGGGGGDTAATAAASTLAAGASPLELLAASTAAAASTPKHHHNKEAKL